MNNLIVRISVVHNEGGPMGRSEFNVKKVMLSPYRDVKIVSYVLEAIGEAVTQLEN